MKQIQYYKNGDERITGSLVNLWDVLAILLIFSILFALTWGAKHMATPYLIGERIQISTHPSVLPEYAIRTVLRMFIALMCSLLFTFTIGTWATRSKRAEQIIIPMIDILQAVPVLSFLSIAVAPFIALFPGSLLGPECASIFAIFTAQAWNMALGFYQSLKTVPRDLEEAAAVYQLSKWQRFWRIEVPFSMPSLIWNTMMSMSASWFFVVASEAITVANQDIRLPGIGSYIFVAIEQANLDAVGYAILAMLIIILIYDQLVFRPLLAWAEKFKFDMAPDLRASRSWFVWLLQKSQLVQYGGLFFNRLLDNCINYKFGKRRPFMDKPLNPRITLLSTWLWRISTTIALIWAVALLSRFIMTAVTPDEIWHVFLLGCATATRVVVLIIISSIIWVPIGIWIGRNPTVATTIQPIVQFAASFPAYLLFPLVAIAIVKYQLNPEIWTTPLMILGSQWYILFNVIAGASSLPKDLYLAADNLGLHGWKWWKRLALPGIFPYYITGAITAAGGAWNASIVAEWVSWGDTTIRATGLGEYIKQYTLVGDFQRIALGTAMMCLFVLVFNRILWRPLYNLASRRYNIE